MLFRFVTTLTEEDYFNFDVFHYLERAKAKAEIRKQHIKFIAYMAFLTITYIIIFRWRPSSIIAAATMVPLTALYLIVYKSLCKRSLKKRMKQLKKDGKLPFTSPTTNEFYEDTFVDLTETTRIEQSYDALDRVCVVKDRYIVLYMRNETAHILPTAQIKEQVNCDDFLRFISTKCNNIENYD